MLLRRGWDRGHVNMSTSVVDTAMLKMSVVPRHGPFVSAGGESEAMLRVPCQGRTAEILLETGILSGHKGHKDPIPGREGFSVQGCPDHFW